MRYIYERGKRRRVMHIARYDSLGHLLMSSFCWSPLPFDTTVNVPLGRKTCKNCLRNIERGF